MDVQILLVPYDTALRGWRMGAGPEHLLAAGLDTQIARSGRQIHVETITTESGPAEIRTAFELMRFLAKRVRMAQAAGRFPLVLAGNCNVAVGILSGLSPARTTVLWFDSHCDFNTPDTTTSGFLDGMALSTATGRCWRQLAASVPGFQPVRERDVLLLGTRDLEPLEAQLLAASEVRLLSPAQVRTSLADELAQRAPEVSAGYVHCDLDVLDPREGPANPFPAPDGLTVQEVQEAINVIGRVLTIRAAAVTAYDPTFDVDGRVCQAAFRIVESLLEAAPIPQT